VGGREYDAEKVGYKSSHPTAGGGFEFRVKGDDGKPILGNYNSGHEGPGFGTDLTEAQRLMLVEYLKTL